MHGCAYVWTMEAGGLVSHFHTFHFQYVFHFQRGTKHPSLSAWPSTELLYSSLASRPRSFIASDFVIGDHFYASMHACNFLYHIYLFFLSPCANFLSGTASLTLPLSLSSNLRHQFSESFHTSNTTSYQQQKSRTQCVTFTFHLCPTINISVCLLSRSLTLPSSSIHCWNPSHLSLFGKSNAVESSRMIGIKIHCLVHCLFCISFMRTAPSSGEFCVMTFVD